MGLQLDFDVEGYIIHDIRSISGEDSVRKAAVDLADEVMAGIKSLEMSHTVMTTILLINDEGAHLILLTRSFDTEPVEKRLDSVLKRVTHDPLTGSLYTYVIPILQRGPREELSIDSDEQAETSQP